MYTSRASAIIYSLLLALLPASLQAAPIIHGTNLPYEPLPVNAVLQERQVYLGTLAGDPHLYEVTITEPKDFNLMLYQRRAESSLVPLSVIIVKENESGKGVTEIGRYIGSTEAWTEVWHGALALRVWQSELLQYDLSPGVYRFEVSTPENSGQYALVLGGEVEQSYTKQWQEARAVQDFFGVSSFRMLLSTLFLYPFGSLLLLSAIYFTWRYQRRREAR